MTATIAERALEWAAANPEAMAWIGSNVESNDFARSLAQGIEKYGSLTQPQLDAVLRKIQQAKNRTAAPEVNVAEIEARFAAARERLVKKPMMRLDTFVFKYAGDTGRNAGAIYVTDATKKDAFGKAPYLGKVMGGKFLRMIACNDDQQARILAAASNPAEGAKAYGQRTGNCSICGRELTAEDSLEFFVGPVCRDKYGI